MALSMDEQRMLAEIERRLSAEDPRLAARLSSFRQPGPASRFRSPRARVIASLFAVAVVAVVSMMVYAMVPFRAHDANSTTSPQAPTSAPAVTGPATVAANRSATANQNAAARTSAASRTPVQVRSTAPNSTAPKISAAPKARTANVSGGTGASKMAGASGAKDAMYAAK